MWGLRRPALLLGLLVLRSSARRLRHELLSAGAESELRPWRLCRVRLAARGAGPSRGSLKQPSAELRYWVHRSNGSGLWRVVVRVHLGGLTELGKSKLLELFACRAGRPTTTAIGTVVAKEQGFAGETDVNKPLFGLDHC